MVVWVSFRLATSAVSANWWVCQKLQGTYDLTDTLRQKWYFSNSCYLDNLLIYLFWPSDAKRPCSTCFRSHAHAVAHAPPGTELPSQPECTFDDGEYLALLIRDTRDENTLAVPESTPAIAEGTKSRYERLENRISRSSSVISLYVLSSPNLRRAWSSLASKRTRKWFKCHQPSTVRNFIKFSW